MIKNGDVWDIGQTVNRSRFLYLDSKWYYAVGYERKYSLFKSQLYEYDGGELSKLVNEYDGGETKLVGNIFTDDMDLDFSQCHEVLQSIRDYRLNKIL
jgi:hypothetical protein